MKLSKHYHPCARASICCVERGLWLVAAPVIERLLPMPTRMTPPPSPPVFSSQRAKLVPRTRHRREREAAHRQGTPLPSTRRKELFMQFTLGVAYRFYWDLMKRSGSDLWNKLKITVDSRSGSWPNQPIVDQLRPDQRETTERRKRVYKSVQAVFFRLSALVLFTYPFQI